MNEEVEMVISCHDCVRRGTPDCADCLVSFVLGETPEELAMTAGDAQIVQLFTSEGLLPRLRFHTAQARTTE